MNAFPAFIPLYDARIVVVGDGPAAEAKARLLDGSPGQILRVPAARAADPLAYEGARLAFVALDDEETAVAAAAAARAAGALVNVVDRQHLGDFHTPAIVDRSPVICAIGTGGAAPVFATLLRNSIEARWPEGLGAVAALSGELQARVREAISTPSERRAFWRRVLDGPAGEAAMAGDIEAARRLAIAELDGPAAEGRVLFLDPPADAGLMSLAAVRALGRVDRIVADEGVSREIMGFARRDAERTATATADQLAAWAREGLSVLSVGAERGTMEAVAAFGVRTERLPVAA